MSELHAVPARRVPRRLWTALALAFYVLMLLWSAVPGQEAALFGQTSDKALHFAAYGCIALALYLGECGPPGRRAVRMLLAVAALGALDETIQRFEPHRTPDLLDWTVDLLAAVVVAAAAGVVQRRVGGRRRPSKAH